MFEDCLAATLAYEKKMRCKVHKGAPTFNVSIAYLRSWDFSAAMHYLDLCQEETRRAYGEKNMSIFLHQLFDRLYWDKLDTDLREPGSKLLLYKKLWGERMRKKPAKLSWDLLTDDSKILYIICLVRRMRERELERQSHFRKSEGLALSYWTLAADLARILETEVKAKTQLANEQLHGMLSKGLKHVTLGTSKSISARFIDLHKIYKVKDTPTFNAAFRTIEQAIKTSTNPHFEKVCQCVYLFYATRNQVAHKLDAAMVLYTDIEAAKFTTDVLICLCRLGAWTV
jgi:hypothetical protein